MTLTPTELAARLQSSNPPRLLDVRTPGEYAVAQLPESRLIPLGELLERVEELEDWRDQEIVVYCHHGIRSAHAIAFLRTAGFTQLWNLTGGIDRFSEEVDPSIPRY